MKAVVRIENAQSNLQFNAEFPHDVCIEEEFVYRGERFVIVDIFLENITPSPSSGLVGASSHSGKPDPVQFVHVVICEPHVDNATD